MVLCHVCKPFWLLTHVFCEAVPGTDLPEMNPTFKFLETENELINFGLQVSTDNRVCPGERVQSSPSVAFRVFKELHQHFSSLYTLELEQ